MLNDQNNTTQKFIEEAKNIVEKGIEPNYKAIATKIGWHYNALWQTLDGRRNIPLAMYRKFSDIYLQEVAAPKMEAKEDYKDKYIALLEEYLETKKGIETEIVDLKNQIKDIQNKVNALFKAKESHFNS